MFSEQLIELFTKAADIFKLEADDTEKVTDILSQIGVTVEIASAFYLAYEKAKDILDDPDLTGAERAAMLAETRKSIEALKNL